MRRRSEGVEILAGFWREEMGHEGMGVRAWLWEDCRLLCFQCSLEFRDNVDCSPIFLLQSRGLPSLLMRLRSLPLLQNIRDGGRSHIGAIFVANSVWIFDS